MDLQLSIVIPCFNEEIHIGLCLSSIKESIKQIQYEIIVVDNGSTDKTRSIAQDFAGVSTFSIGRQTISYARNYGVSQSKACLIAFIDADVVVTTLWGETVSAWAASGAGSRNFMSGYAYSIRDKASMIERAWFTTILMVPAKYLNGGNIVVSRQAFNKLGGFNQFLQTGEDFDFCERAASCGLTIVFEPMLEVIHLGYPAGIRHFFRRESWHGIGDFQSLRLFIHSKVALAAVLFFLLIAVAVAFLTAGWYRAWGLALTGHLALPILFTIYKFRFTNGRYFFAQSFLSYVYLWARIYSPVRLIFERT